MKLIRDGKATTKERKKNREKNTLQTPKDAILKRHFGKYTYSLSCQGVNEKINTTVQ